MQILLFAATINEIKPTINFIKQENLSKKIKVHITGVGLTAACYSITKHALSYPPDLMVQAGVAGSLDPSFTPAQSVFVSTECFGDLGVVEDNQFRSVFDLGLTNKDVFPWKDGKLINPNTEMGTSLNLPKVNAVSIQEITTNPQRTDSYKKKLLAQIETMEGAALHYVGLMENIPFLQLRTISNYVGERDKTHWKLGEAIATLNTHLQQLLPNLIYK